MRLLIKDGYYQRLYGTFEDILTHEDETEELDAPVVTGRLGSEHVKIGLNKYADFRL